MSYKESACETTRKYRVNASFLALLNPNKTKPTQNLHKTRNHQYREENNHRIEHRNHHIQLDAPFTRNVYARHLIKVEWYPSKP